MRRLVVLLLILALVGSTVAPFLSVQANPGPWYVTVPAPADVFLYIRIASPKENASYSNGTINLCFNVTLYGPNNITKGLGGASYKGDWMERVEGCPYPNTHERLNFIQFNVNVTDIPFGEHSLNITAGAQGEYEDNLHRI